MGRRWRRSGLFSCASSSGYTSGSDGSEMVSRSEMELSLREARAAPLLIDVLRSQPPPPSFLPPSASASHATIATQTDPLPQPDDEEDDDEESPLLSSVQPGEMEALELAAEGFIDETDLENHCQETLCHVEYEEISLERERNGERLGLTLCYGSGDDVETDIFVSEVESGSVAGRDGRIKPGDQILQINTVDVLTRNQAMDLFRARSPTVTLLLARTAIEQPPPPASSSISPSSHHHPSRLIHAVLEEASAEEAEAELARLEDSDRAASAQEKDSGISRTTDSDDALPAPLSPQPVQQHPTAPASTDDGLTPTEATFALLQSQTEATLTGSASRESDASLERELASLHREMETVRLECDRLIAQHATAEEKVRKQMETAAELMATVDSLVGSNPGPGTNNDNHPRPSPSQSQPPPKTSHPNPLLQQASARLQHSLPTRSHGQQLSPPTPAHPRSAAETSSAYNTGGDSARSTPLLSKAQLGSAEAARRPRPFGSYRGDRSTPPARDVWAAADAGRASVGCGSDGAFAPGQLMYSRAEDLEATIALQQKLLRQAMLAQAAQLRSAQALGAGPVVPSPAGASGPVEWKVKRRSDGSRYVTKRPVRNRLLKERAAQVSSQRTGLSTDDDAFSELKVGRYWTREEKKRHVEAAKERKRRSEEAAKRRAAAASAQNPILSLADKKAARRRPHQLFDKFTTVQEFLAHGSRNPQDHPHANMGILSVTTV